MNIRSTQRVACVQWSTSGGIAWRVRIPSQLASSHGIAEGTIIEFTELENGGLQLRPAGPSLEEMVRGITPENLHGEFSFGAPTGRESL